MTPTGKASEMHIRSREEWESSSEFVKGASGTLSFPVNHFGLHIGTE
jgi:hypothetical protein